MNKRIRKNIGCTPRILNIRKSSLHSTMSKAVLRSMAHPWTGLSLLMKYSMTALAVQENITVPELD